VGWHCAASSTSLGPRQNRRAKCSLIRPSRSGAAPGPAAAHTGPLARIWTAAWRFTVENVRQGHYNWNRRIMWYGAFGSVRMAASGEALEASLS